MALGDLELNLGSRRFRVAGREVFLTRTEFLLLECLMRNVGTVVTREALQKIARDGEARTACRAIDVHMVRLRRKAQLNGPGSLLLRSVRGIGYALDWCSVPDPATIKKIELHRLIDALPEPEIGRVRRLLESLSMKTAHRAG
ncbi:MAG TPA: winged helix-turn-helix domain-containing protein [Bryobacteraceae bacterium]|nr:winged helix-turn-helix domain-containing protein [Bryobacteraceae bacterium]